MRRRKVLTGVYTQDEGYWLAQVKEIPQVHTFGRTLVKAEDHLRDALTLWLEHDEYDLQFELDLPRKVVDLISRANQEREESKRRQASAADLAVKVAIELVEKRDLSIRDAAHLLGISHQRVQQLLSQQSSIKRPA